MKLDEWKEQKKKLVGFLWNEIVKYPEGFKMKD